jgi:hypothetical protein
VDMRAKTIYRIVKHRYQLLNVSYKSDRMSMKSSEIRGSYNKLKVASALSISLTAATALNTEVKPPSKEVQPTTNEAVDNLYTNLTSQMMRVVKSPKSSETGSIVTASEETTYELVTNAYNKSVSLKGRLARY